MMRLISVAIVLGGMMITPALAQFGNPGGLDPATNERPPNVPAPSSNDTNVQDRLFVKLMTFGGLAEVELAKLADQKTQISAVKDFARRMAEDHGKSNRQLADIGERLKTPVPNYLDPDHVAMRDALGSDTDEPFDVAYMRSQVVEHQKAVQLLEWEIGQGENPELQHFASDTLPIVLRHLQMALDVMTQLTGAAAQGAAPHVAGAESVPH
jgi:putative membrane protein